MYADDNNDKEEDDEQDDYDDYDDGDDELGDDHGDGKADNNPSRHSPGGHSGYEGDTNYNNDPDSGMSYGGVTQNGIHQGP